MMARYDVRSFDWYVIDQPILKAFCLLYPLIFQSREEFESELVERFGSLIKMPLLKDDR